METTIVTARGITTTTVIIMTTMTIDVCARGESLA
jgi:hypothetical protein